MPDPVFEGDPGLVSFYREAWRAVAARVTERPGLPAPVFLDTAAAPDEPRRASDAAFLALVAKYAGPALPGLAAFENFHAALDAAAGEPGAAATSLPGFPVSDEAALPLFGWAEYETALFSGDTARVRALLRGGALQRRYAEMEKWEAPSTGPAAARRVRGYVWSLRGAGMEGSPRTAGRMPDEAFWVDLLAQQCLAALSISRLAALVCDTVLSAKWRGKFSGKKTLLRRWYWDDARSFFFDIARRSMEPLPDETAAGFWAFLAGCAGLREADRFAARLARPDAFGGPVPFPSLSRSHPDWDPDSPDGWRGAVRVPLAYVALRGLSHFGFHARAREMGRTLLEHVRGTWSEYDPPAFWACYHPSERRPAGCPAGGGPPRPDLACGAALAPICIFLEHVIGIHYVDAFRRLVDWDPPDGDGRVGVQNLRFGLNKVDMVIDGLRCYVRAAAPFSLQIRGVRFAVPAGSSILSIPPRGEDVPARLP